MSLRTRLSLHRSLPGPASVRAFPPNASPNRERTGWLRPGGWPSRVALPLPCGQRNRAALAVGWSRVPVAMSDGGVSRTDDCRSRSGLLAQLGRRPGRRARRLPPPRCAAGQVPVIKGTMYCRWHGLALTQNGDQTWSPYRAHGDRVLLWGGLPTEGEDATDRPASHARPPCHNR